MPVIFFASSFCLRAMLQRTAQWVCESYNPTYKKAAEHQNSAAKLYSKNKLI